jgi:hypothetical protein
MIARLKNDLADHLVYLAQEPLRLALGTGLSTLAI